MKRVGVLMVLAGLLLLSVYVNNTFVYSHTVSQRLAWLHEQTWLEPETVLVGEFLVLYVGDTPPMLVTAPTQEDLLERLFLFDQLLKLEKALANATAERLDEVCSHINQLWVQVAALSQFDQELARALRSVASNVAALSARVERLEAVLGNRAVAASAASLEAAVVGRLTSPVTPLTQASSSVVGAVSSAYKAAQVTVNMLLGNWLGALWWALF